MRLGFTGAHRSGKTTLANFAASEYGLTKIDSPAGKIVQGFGFDMGWDNRLAFNRFEGNGSVVTGIDMQWEIYNSLLDSLSEAKDNYVSDRTPIDVAAYLMADATGYVGDEWAREQTVLMAEQAIRDTERLFDVVILTPPLLYYLEEVGKPANNPAYQEHHHFLCRGILFDDDLDLFWDEIRRESFSLETRTNFVRETIADWQKSERIAA